MAAAKKIATADKIAKLKAQQAKLEKQLADAQDEAISEKFETFDLAKLAKIEKYEVANKPVNVWKYVVSSATSSLRIDDLAFLRLLAKSAGIKNISIVIQEKSTEKKVRVTYDDATKKKAVDAAKTGKKKAEVAREFGITQSTLNNWIKASS